VALVPGSVVKRTELSTVAWLGLESAPDPPATKWSEMANADKRKQSLYFPEDMLKEIQHEAQRLDRSLSWIVQQGWKLAREKLKAFPASNDDPEGLPDPREESV
jgi:uncharacterized small protein (TIGR04563 family)